jgi:hypothetical protein
MQAKRSVWLFPSQNVQFSLGNIIQLCLDAASLDAVGQSTILVSGMHQQHPLHMTLSQLVISKLGAFIVADFLVSALLLAAGYTVPWLHLPVEDLCFLVLAHHLMRFDLKHTKTSIRAGIVVMALQYLINAVFWMENLQMSLVERTISIHTLIILILLSAKVLGNLLMMARLLLKASHPTRNYFNENLVALQWMMDNRSDLGYLY